MTRLKIFVIPPIIFVFPNMKELFAIPTNRQHGESCGSCYCPPTSSAGECAPGLTCVSGTPYIPDAPGTCVREGIPSVPFTYNKNEKFNSYNAPYN